MEIELNENIEIGIEKALEGETIGEEDNKRYIIDAEEFDTVRFLEQISKEYGKNYDIDELRKVKLNINLFIDICRYKIINGEWVNKEQWEESELYNDSKIRITPTYDTNDVLGANLEIVNTDTHTIEHFSIRIDRMMEALSKILEINHVLSQTLPDD